MDGKFGVEILIERDISHFKANLNDKAETS